MARRIAVIVVLVAVLIAALVYSQMRPEPLFVSGYIEAYEIQIGSRVGGRVMKVLVQEGDRAAAGQTLIELEPFDLLHQRAQAEAQLALSRQRLAELRAGPRVQEIEAARGNVRTAEARAELAGISYRHVKEVFERKAATQEELDRATAQLDSARGELASTQAQLDLLLAGTRPEQIAQAEAAVTATEATLATLDTRIAELAIKASVDGRIEALDLRPGDLVAANAPVLTLLDGSELWVRAYVPQSRLDIQIDQKAAVTVDSYPDRRFAGHISFIASEGEFTPRNVQTPEERSKQVFRIKVVLDEGRDVLRPGMSADVWLEEPR